MPTTRQIADHVKGQLIGSGDIDITDMNNLADATAAQISFIRDSSHADGWKTSNASAALVGPNIELEPGDGKALIRVDNADLAVALVLELIAPPRIEPALGIHDSAVISKSARLGSNVRIGPHCVIESGVTIGDNCVLHTNITIMAHSSLGNDCIIYPGAVIRERCTIGQRCIIHPNVVIGADGFGFRPSADGKSVVKIPQIGTVRIGHDVEIGAGTCIDRAKFSQTVIGDYTKIDNLCQIAHNCVIGRCCIIAGQVGLSGSVTVGDGVMLGGKAAVKDQITIGQGAMIAGGAMVMNDVPAHATWGGYPAQDLRLTLREVAAVRKLPDFMKSMRKKST